MPTGWKGKRNTTPYAGSGYAWTRLRNRVLTRDGYQCRYCGGQATTADHVLARAQGGPDTMENLVACCRGCNEKRRIQQSVQGRRLKGAVRW